MTRYKLLAGILAGTILFPSLLHADGLLPTDPTVLAGDIAFSNPSAIELLLQQSGDAGIVDWGSFSIGSGYTVQIQNGAGATLNRVTGTDFSSILGSLNATGSVYLINQNGIVFGKTGVVDTGGRFVASTLDIGNADFLDGGDNIFRGDVGSYVINLGTISSLGGDVSLMARTVVNDGTISAANGTVGLAAGREILMRDASVDEGMFSVRIGGSDTSVTDSGSVRAAAAELRANGGNVYALAGNTTGTIAATGVATVKGRVFLTSGQGGNVTINKTVKATGADGKGGFVQVDGGQVDLNGVLDVSGSSGGEVRITSTVSTVFTGEVLAFGMGANSGGFTEVSGAHLAFSGTVDTGGGTLLIDPNNIEITNGSPLLAGASSFSTDTLLAQLRLGNVVLDSTGTDGEAGVILVSSALDYDSTSNLTLLAQGDIVANALIRNSNSSGGDINLVAGWNGTTAFDAATFDSANLLTQTFFGNITAAAYKIGSTRFVANGDVLIGDGAQMSGIAIGSRMGATRVYSRAFVLQGSNDSRSNFGFAQLGYNVTVGGAGFSTDGDISVRAVSVLLAAGGGNGAAAQIGQVGLNGTSAAAVANSDTNISIETSGDLTLIGAGSAATSGINFAQIGNGAMGFSSLPFTPGTASGLISIVAGGEVSLQNGLGAGDEAWIGHGKATSNSASAADIFISAASIDTDAATSVVSGGIGSLDIAMVAANLKRGNYTVVTTDSGLKLFGNTNTSSCECASINTTTDLVVQTSGTLRLDPNFAFSNLGGGNIALSTDTHFLNNSGADAFGTMKGRWLIYSKRPDENVGGIAVLPANFLDYQATFDPGNPFGTAFAGNGFLFSVNPVISIADGTMTYGGVLPSVLVDLRVNGVVVNAADFGISLGGAFIDGTKVTFSGTGLINAGGYANALGAFASILPSTITSVSRFSLDQGRLTVDKAVLTAVVTGTPTKIYDGNTAAALTSLNFTLGGFMAGEGGSITETAGTYAFANASVANTVTVALSSGVFSATGTTLLSNYVLPTTATGNGSITQKAVTATITGTPTKVYDGNTGAILTDLNFSLVGFIAGEGATVTQTVGNYASANASATDAVTATLSATDFTTSGSTLLSNYALPVLATGNGAISQKVLTATIIGTPTKEYDAAAAAELTDQNFNLVGFVGGDDATVTQTAGTYASANASVANVVTAVLVASNFSAASSTLMSNYVLPTSATGNGVITQRAVTATIIGTPTKSYDGSTEATLTNLNFSLAGFITGEGANVSQTTATYASANASATNSVSATLAAGNFSATGSTLLSNYALPTAASGNGVINRAILTASIVGLPTKPFDGTTTVVLTPPNFSLIGFASGEGATVTQTQGTYASAAAGFGNAVSATLSASDFSATGSTLLANYVLPTTANGPGLIDSAPPPQPLPPETRGLEPFDTTPLGQPTGPATGIQTIDPETTQRILDEIRAGSAFCKALVHQEYVIDCLSDRLQSVAAGLSAVGEYSEVRAALEDAAQKLHALALQNASAELAQTIALASGDRRSSRPLTAISAAAAAAANIEAAAILNGAELVLLRSGSGSARRSVAFSQVAQVVNSTKVLLRSS